MLVAGAAAGGMGYAAGRRGAQQQEPAYDEPAAPPPAPPAPAPAEVDAASEIERLASLHESGALTDDEFATAKQNVLGA